MKTMNCFFFVGFLVLFLSCAEKSSDAATITTDNVQFKIASSEYAKIVEKALEHWANQDFDAYGELLDEDLISYNPYEPHDLQFARKSREEEVAGYKSWTKYSEVENIVFSNTTLIPLATTDTNKLYLDSGVSVVVYATMEMTIFGKPTSNGVSILYHFNDDKLIDKAYLFYDINQQMNAMN